MADVSPSSPPIQPAPAQAKGGVPLRRSKDREESKDAEQARAILGQEGGDFEQLLQLAGRLKSARQYSYARRLLARARAEMPGSLSPARARKIAQAHALATYQDPELPAEARYIEALKILGSADDLPSTTDRETLGLAGAIHKRWWSVDQQKQRLETAASYYRRGYSGGVAQPADFDGFSYCAINAAFVLDLLARQEQRAAKTDGSPTPPLAATYSAEARSIRQRILDKFAALAPPPKNWWINVTLAEACFGLQSYADAERWLGEAAGIGADDWQLQTTVRQLAALARIQEETNVPVAGTPTPTERVAGLLRIFFGDQVGAASSVSTGKIGLALSGGGFRASLFHIGVLARLAELDLLGRVEVLSCVSGGSIIGAHYYLEVQHLLESTPDAQITRQHYLDIIHRLETEFLAGVQKNIRLRVAAHLPTSLRMVFQPHFSRTVRLGQLYEEVLFARVQDGGKGGAPRFLDQLLVHPVDGPEDFQPRLDNWRRRAKVPELVLNATALNTGHPWQFTASWMGEPPAPVEDEIDGNDRLRRMYYWQAPAKFRHVRLGLAVAASSCVPGLFEPVAFEGLFPDRTVRLVDGGVHDNQGIGSLIEQECDIVLVSDASGQSASERNPRSSLLSVSTRVNDLLMARVRESQHQELKTRRRASLLRGFMFVHLKRDLGVDVADWIDCQDPQELGTLVKTAERAKADLTSYGMPKEVQRRLAAIRTDLDSFSDLEAFALMASGYQMAKEDLATLTQSLPDLAPSEDSKEPWKFLEIGNFMDRSGAGKKSYKQLLGLLEVSKHLPFKVWRLAPIRCALVAAAVGLSLFLVLTAACCLYTRETSAPVAGADLISLSIYLALRLIAAVCAVLLALALVLTTAGLAFAGIYRLCVMRCKTAIEVFLGSMLCSGGTVLALLHLSIFDPLFLRIGRCQSKQASPNKSDLPVQSKPDNKS